jgi:FtsZ-interacting cell division protein ZipA
MTWLWVLIGVVLAALVLVAWRMDARVRRRGSRVFASSDVWYQVRESRRDAELVNPVANDHSWTSWSRRNRR